MDQTRNLQSGTICHRLSHEHHFDSHVAWNAIKRTFGVECKLHIKAGTITVCTPENGMKIIKTCVRAKPGGPDQGTHAVENMLADDAGAGHLNRIWIEGRLPDVDQGRLPDVNPGRLSDVSKGRLPDVNEGTQHDVCNHAVSQCACRTATGHF